MAPARKSAGVGADAAGVDGSETAGASTSLASAEAEPVPKPQKSSAPKALAAAAAGQASDWAAKRRAKIEAALARKAAAEHGTVTEEHTFRPETLSRRVASRLSGRSPGPPRSAVPLANVQAATANSAMVTAVTPRVAMLGARRRGQSGGSAATAGSAATSGRAASRREQAATPRSGQRRVLVSSAAAASSASTYAPWLRSSGRISTASTHSLGSSFGDWNACDVTFCDARHGFEFSNASIEPLDMEGGELANTSEYQHNGESDWQQLPGASTLVNGTGDCGLDAMAESAVVVWPPQGSGRAIGFGTGAGDIDTGGDAAGGPPQSQQDARLVHERGGMHRATVSRDLECTVRTVESLRGVPLPPSGSSDIEETTGMLAPARVGASPAPRQSGMAIDGDSRPPSPLRPSTFTWRSVAFDAEAEQKPRHANPTPPASPCGCQSPQVAVVASWREAPLRREELGERPHPAAPPWFAHGPRPGVATTPGGVGLPRDVRPHPLSNPVVTTPGASPVTPASVSFGEEQLRPRRHFEDAIAQRGAVVWAGSAARSEPLANASVQGEAPSIAPASLTLEAQSLDARTADEQAPDLAPEQIGGLVLDQARDQALDQAPEKASGEQPFEAKAPTGLEIDAVERSAPADADTLIEVRSGQAEALWQAAMNAPAEASEEAPAKSLVYEEGEVLDPRDVTDVACQKRPSLEPSPTKADSLQALRTFSERMHVVRQREADLHRVHRSQIDELELKCAAMERSLGVADTDKLAATADVAADSETTVAAASSEASKDTESPLQGRKLQARLIASPSLLPQIPKSICARASTVPARSATLKALLPLASPAAPARSTSSFGLDSCGCTTPANSEHSTPISANDLRRERGTSTDVETLMAMVRGLHESPAGSVPDGGLEQLESQVQRFTQLLSQIHETEKTLASTPTSAGACRCPNANQRRFGPDDRIHDNS